jgi:hypothetical protein
MMNKWTEFEIMAVIRLYCLTPFGRIDKNNPNILKLAVRLGRTPGAVTLKMANIASLDPTIGQKGMSNVSKMDRQTWNKFFNNIDKYLDEFDTILEEKSEDGFSDSEQQKYEHDPNRLGIDKYRVSSSRIGQGFFRDIVLASYDNKCALTGIGDTRLLNASHIAPWAANLGRRLDPCNGLCLNALHDRAFDAGLISFDNNNEILFSQKLEDSSKRVLSESLVTNRLQPTRFTPDAELMREHRVRHGFS